MKCVFWQRGGKPAWSLLLGALAVAVLCPNGASAYVEEGYHWPFNQPVVLNLQLDSTVYSNYTRTDGSTSWSEVAEAAMSIWNADLGSSVQFHSSYKTLTPAQHDGVNSVLFSYSAFGEDFGSDTLAVTIYYGDTSTSLFTEADVVFNKNCTFNSYRGPLKMDGPFVSTYDFRRVALHEFGHVLGLGHVAQGTASIMTPAITDIDTIQDDDIAGIEAIYGNPTPAVPFISSPLTVKTALNEPFSYQTTALDFPTGFGASGLPAGLSLDPATGKISGTPTVTGTYQVVLTATGSTGLGAATLILTVTAAPSITSSLTVVAYVDQPFLYQISATSSPTHFSATPPLTNTSSLPNGLKLDEKTGVISGTPARSGPFTIVLTATNAVASGTANLQLDVANDATLKVLSIEGTFDGSFSSLANNGTSALVRGGDGNVYGTTISGGAYGQGSIFRLNTDDDTRETIFDFGAPGPYQPTSMQRAADGSFSGLTLRGGANDLGAIYHVDTGGTLTTVYSFASDEYTVSRTLAVIRGGDGNYYGTVGYGIFYTFTDYAGSVFKVTPDGVMTTLHQFDGGDGFYPSALVEGTDGSFYGTTREGGSQNYGTVFKITPGGAFTTLHHFTFGGGEGLIPVAPLMQAADGNFYGSTIQGGTVIDDGTIFKITPDGAFTTIHAFTDVEGRNPASALVQGGDGKIYGTTGNGTLGGLNNTLFEMTPDGTLTNLHVFAGFDGEPPFLPLVPAGNGALYGAGKGSSGPVFFKEIPSGAVVTPNDPVFHPPAVTLEATTPKVTLGSGQTGVFTLHLPAPQTTDILVNLRVKGTAVNGTDYVLLKTSKLIKAGKLSKSIKITPLGDLGGASKKAVALVIAPGNDYTVGTTGKVKVAILAAGQ